MTAAESKIEKEITVEEKLFALYDLQKVVSKIDEIKIPSLYCDSKFILTL